MSNLKKIFVLISILIISIVFVSCSMLSQNNNGSDDTTTEEGSDSGSKFVINTGSTTNKKPTTTTNKDDESINTDKKDDESAGTDTGNATAKDETHTCSFTISKYDDDYHWIACSHEGCDKYITKEAHAYTVTYIDANTHASICSCGRTANTENHSLSYKQTTTGHYQECSKCKTHTQEAAHSSSGWAETAAKSMCKKCDTCSYIMETSVETSLNTQMKQELNSSITDGDFKTTSSYTAYAQAATADFIIPGINQYFVVQAVDVWETKSIMLISGYFDVGTKNITTVSSCSVIFAVNMSTGKLIGEYYVLNNGGEDHNNHDGGIAVTNNNIYLAVGNKLHRISLDSLKDNKNGNYPSTQNYVSKYVEIKETISMPVKASYCNYSGGYIWVGDFLYKNSGTQSYTTVPHDELTNSEDSSTNYGAWVVGYKVDETKPNQEISTTPACAFGVREKVQGITYDSNGHKFYMTTSYGRTNNSTLYSYSFNAFNGNPDTTVTINNTSVKFWFLDSTYSEKSYTIPPMAECPTITTIYDDDGSSYTKLYIPFESSSKKYSQGLDDKGTCSFVQQRIHSVDVNNLT